MFAGTVGGVGTIAAAAAGWAIAWWLGRPSPVVDVPRQRGLDLGQPGLQLGVVAVLQRLFEGDGRGPQIAVAQRRLALLPEPRQPGRPLLDLGRRQGVGLALQLAQLVGRVGSPELLQPGSGQLRRLLRLALAQDRVNVLGDLLRRGLLLDHAPQPVDLLADLVGVLDFLGCLQRSHGVRVLPPAHPVKCLQQDRIVPVLRA